MVVYYNEDLFKAAGLQTPAELSKAGKWDWAALADASANSAIGKIAIVYAGLLESYLSDPTTTTTLVDLQAALADAANKPLSPEIIQAVNDKLATVDPTTIGTSIGAYTGGSEALAASAKSPCGSNTATPSPFRKSEAIRFPNNVDLPAPVRPIASI